MDSNDAVRADIERWLLRRGAPHFIDGYRATTNVWTRAFPVIVVLWIVGLVAEVGLADNARVLTVAVGALGVLAVWVVSNLLRRRPPFALPVTIGVHELVFFAVTPGLLSMVLVHDLGQSVLSVVIGVVLLAVVYVCTSYGVVSMTRYVLQRLRDQLRLLGKLSSRAIPLLVLITVSIFFTSETWQMSARLEGVAQIATPGLFVVFGGLFLLARVPGTVGALERFDEWSEVRDAIAGTPAALVDLPESGDPEEPSQTRGQRINLIVIAVATQAVQITLVAAIVYVFFLVLGTVSIHPEAAKLFIGDTPHILLSANLGGSRFTVTEELLRVSAFLSAFSGMAFTVYLVTDSTYQAEFASDVSTELRQVLGVRLAYRWTRR